jgi:hypothetical protein
MLEELNDCNFRNPNFYGAELTDGCVKYHVSLSRPTNDDDLPFKPLPHEMAECRKDDGDTTVVSYNFWQGVFIKFSQDMGDGKKGKR